MTGYAEGLVVVRRHTSNTERRTRRALVMWTLHTEDCRYIQRPNNGTVKAIPAPAVPYPNTVDCAGCRPNHPHRITRTFDEKTGDRIHTCRCGLVARHGNPEAARAQLRRAHERAAAMEEATTDG